MAQFHQLAGGHSASGLIVSTLNEPIPFKSFLLKGETVLLERAIPDPMGTRFIVLAFEAIHMLKLTDPLERSGFHDAGLWGTLRRCRVLLPADASHEPRQSPLRAVSGR